LHYSDKVAPEFAYLYAQCDVLITTGDLSVFDFSGLHDFSDKKPAFGVYGNHDSGQYLEELGIINLHKKVFEWNGLRWGGFQGCLKYKDKSLMFTESDAKEFADTFEPVDVLLLHAGPREMLDDPSDSVHVGSENIKRYVMNTQPKFIFLGHQYSDAQMTHGSIKLFRTYGARLIEL